MANQLPIPSPDFASIRDSIKEFLSNQDELKDYDFEGSTMSVILDTLAYNTHINSFYLNMVANESFLSSAVKRESVVAKALQLGYIPKSVTSAMAFVDVTLESTSTDAFITIPINTIFTAKSQEDSFTFRTHKSFTAVKQENGVYKATDVLLHEGKQMTHTFVVDSIQKLIDNSYVLPNPNVDTSILRVFVSRLDNQFLFDEYKLNTSIVENTPDSLIYYLEETAGGLHKISFGDNRLSKGLLPGQIIRVEYVISRGKEANGIKNFTMQNTIPGVLSTSVVAKSIANGGSDAESINSIKFNAPRHFSIQNRAVTATDFQHIVRLIYPNVDDVVSKGGEDVVPPIYNKVALYIKPKTGFYLSDSEKRNLIPAIKQYSTILTEPVILDPEYLYVNVFTTVDYSALASQKVENDLRQEIYDKIKDYSGIFLGKFEKDLRYSSILSYIDKIDPSILSNITILQTEKRIFLDVLTKRDYDFTFSTQLRPGTFISSSFDILTKTNCYFEDDSNGNIVLKSLSQNAEISIVDLQAGTINYKTGKIYIKPIQPVQVVETDEFFDEDLADYFVKFKCNTENQDINKNSEQIILINDVNITLNAGA